MKYWELLKNIFTMFYLLFYNHNLNYITMVVILKYALIVSVVLIIIKVIYLYFINIYDKITLDSVQ